MDYWQINLFVEERCADIDREVAQYRLISQLASGNHWFDEWMHTLGLWLVSIGENLCKRYSITNTKTALKGF